MRQKMHMVEVTKNSMTVTFYANFEPKISVERGADLQIYRGGIFNFFENFIDPFLGFDKNDSPSASRSLKRPYFDKKLIATGKFLNKKAGHNAVFGHFLENFD